MAENISLLRKKYNWENESEKLIELYEKHKIPKTHLTVGKDKMKTIVFVRNGAYPRMYNQVYALKGSKKYRLVLVCKTFDSYTLSKFNEVFDEIVCCYPLGLQSHELSKKIKDSPNSPMIHLMKHMITQYIDPRIKWLSKRLMLPAIIKRLKADVFNCDPGTSDLTDYVMRNTKCPVILDCCNGSIAAGIENLSKEEQEMDKFCFEHADGIIYRGPEREMEYYRNHGYKIASPVLHYVDYCNKEFFVNNNVKKLSDEDGEYHIVNIGSGTYSHDNIAFAKKFTKQKIHLHLYSRLYHVSSVVFREYIKLNKTEKYFHLEESVPFDNVPQDIAKYDFGLHMTGDLYKYRQEYLKLAVSNRIFTYLEAGLPIIISDRFEYMKKMVEENKMGFSVKDEEIDNLYSMIEKHNYNELRDNVFEARKKFLIDNYAERLIKFYEDIIQRG